jgi:hypothetical protein
MAFSCLADKAADIITHIQDWQNVALGSFPTLSLARTPTPNALSSASNTFLILLYFQKIINSSMISLQVTQVKWTFCASAFHSIMVITSFILDHCMCLSSQ